MQIDAGTSESEGIKKGKEVRKTEGKPKGSNNKNWVGEARYA